MKRKNRFPRLSRSGMFYPVSGEKLTHVPNVSLTYEMQVVMLSCSGLPRQKEISSRACRLAKDDLGRTLQTKIPSEFHMCGFWASRSEPTKCYHVA